MRMSRFNRFQFSETRPGAKAVAWVRIPGPRVVPVRGKFKWTVDQKVSLAFNWMILAPAVLRS